LQLIWLPPTTHFEVANETQSQLKQAFFFLTLKRRLSSTGANQHPRNDDAGKKYLLAESIIPQRHLLSQAEGQKFAFNANSSARRLLCFVALCIMIFRFCFQL